MKIDRLLGIIMHLLNHDISSAKALAHKFEVSERTIQRDIDALTLAGIPVMAVKGAGGGYGIVDGFRMDRHLASAEDFLYIITALKGLCSGYGGKKLYSTLEKVLALAPPGNGSKQKLILDFGVLKENSRINNRMEIIEKAIETETAVEFDYTNADGYASHRSVEPLALAYKWYAWYLFGYCCEKKDYRLFRLSRIGSLINTRKIFSAKHGNTDGLMAEYEKRDNRRYLDIKLMCRVEMRVAAEEAFPGGAITAQDNGDIVIRLRVPENERMWFAALLSFGDRITVIEPEILKERLVKKAEEILNLYKLHK